ncbi:hypothetical protein [Actinocorallia herbida]|nr:hypothetical protein [Actinocorallia herbida]
MGDGRESCGSGARGAVLGWVGHPVTVGAVVGELASICSVLVTAA